MSFEINGNSATITKRRSRDKSNTQTPKLQKNGFQTPNYNLSPPLNAFPNPNIPEHAPYYFPVTYQHRMTTEPMSLPIYPLGCSTIPYSTNPNLHPRGYVNNATKYPFQNNEEYASLPIGNFGQNDASLDKRRFSDPGLPFDSDSSTNSFDDRIVHKLTQQVHALKENNRKLNRELVEMRIELNMLKQQQNSRHFDRDYEPGMLAEIIKEIRDAARVREDALLAKVKHMIEERQFNMNQMTINAEKVRNNERIAKLEEQLKNLALTQTRSDDSASVPTTYAANTDDGPNSARQVIELEREALVLRRELQDARAKKEETDKRFIQLEKKLETLLHHSESIACDASEDGKASNSSSPFSFPILSSAPPPIPQRVTLTGPVTDL